MTFGIYVTCKKSTVCGQHHEILPTDIEVTAASSPLTEIFPPPDARIIQIYVTGLQ
jgi:hypothetical protein